MIKTFFIGLSVLFAAASSGQTKAPIHPDTLIVLTHGKSIQVDGVISPYEWTDADSLFIEIEPNWISTIYFKCDSSHVFFAFKNLEKVSGKPHVANLFVDKSNNKSTNWKSDDVWLHASYSDCEAIGNYYVWSNCTTTDKPDWLANNLPFRSGNDNIEMQINFSKFVLKTFPDTLGFCISIGYNEEKNYWPRKADLDRPSTWGYLVFPKVENTQIHKLRH
jgi:hypothetical protein